MYQSSNSSINTIVFISFGAYLRSQISWPEASYGRGDWSCGTDLGDFLFNSQVGFFFCSPPFPQSGWRGGGEWMGYWHRPLGWLRWPSKHQVNIQPPRWVDLNFCFLYVSKSSSLVFLLAGQTGPSLYPKEWQRRTRPRLELQDTQQCFASRSLCIQHCSHHQQDLRVMQCQTKEEKSHSNIRPSPYVALTQIYLMQPL